MVSLPRQRINIIPLDSTSPTPRPRPTCPDTTELGRASATSLTQHTLFYVFFFDSFVFFFVHTVSWGRRGNGARTNFRACCSSRARRRPGTPRSTSGRSGTSWPSTGALTSTDAGRRGGIDGEKACCLECSGSGRWPAFLLGTCRDFVCGFFLSLDFFLPVSGLVCGRSWVAAASGGLF